MQIISKHGNSFCFMKVTRLFFERMEMLCLWWHSEKMDDRIQVNKFRMVVKPLICIQAHGLQSLIAKYTYARHSIRVICSADATSTEPCYCVNMINALSRYLTSYTHHHQPPECHAFCDGIVTICHCSSLHISVLLCAQITSRQRAHICTINFI